MRQAQWAPNKYSVPTFIKWAGGKSKLLSIFDTYTPRKFNNYFEPFLGGGAMFFFLRQQYVNGAKKFIISDINEELINCYKTVRDNSNELIKNLEIHRQNHVRDGRQYYNLVRNLSPEDIPSTILKAVRFIYLNKTCYNGLYRINSKGQFNVPMGKYSNPCIYGKEIIYWASRLLQNVDIRVQSYQKILSRVKEGDFVYLDPPYYSDSPTSNFTSYNGSTFSEQDQKEVAKTFKELDKMGCFVMLCNSNYEFIRALYRGYITETVRVNRMINCVADKRGPVEEIVVRNYG